MFAFREHLDLDPGTAAAARVEVAFTDATLDLQGGRDGFAEALAALEQETGVVHARLSQVHGDDVVEVTEVPMPGPTDDVRVADAQVTTLRGVGLMVRVADCVPVVLAGSSGPSGRGPVLGVAHAGRRGVEVDVVARTVERMRVLGATDLHGWIGPHVCGRCYEVPEQMRDDVARRVPATRAETRQGTPALDLGAGVRAQLEAVGVTVTTVPGCTLEDDRFHSYRRDHARSGRIAGLVWSR